MGLVLAVLYESNWLREDGAKLFFFGACFLAFLALAKYASRRSESSYEQPPHERPDIPTADLEKYYERDDSVEEEEDPRATARSVSFTLHTVQFKSFDVETGPPDRQVFCDEVAVNLNYRSHVMPWRFVVATPEGIAAKIARYDWKSEFLPQEVMIVPYWDHDRIMADLSERIRTELEAVPEEFADDQVKQADEAF